MIEIEEHEGLVIQVAKRFRFVPSGVTRDELLAAGRVGLWIAATRFDPARGFRFSTYATFWVRQSIGRFLQQVRSTVKVPFHVQEALSRARRTGEELDDACRAAVLAQATTSLHDEDGQILHDVAVLDPEPEDSQRLHRLIGELPIREREVVQALYIDGARVREVASRLRVSPAVVRKTRERGLGRLREMLEVA